MSEGTKLAALAAAAEAYGDAMVAHEAAFRAWKRGDPIPRASSRDVESGLLSAARAYATATRRKRRPTPQGEKEP